jgi:quercetin dioxygenase-like cupin family protein
LNDVIEEGLEMKLPAAAPRFKEILLETNEMPWQAKASKGVYEKMLWRDEVTGALIALIRYEKGAGTPKPHAHVSNQMMFCLSGHFEYSTTGVTLKAGSFYCNPKGNVHGPSVAIEESVMVEIFDGPSSSPYAE